jgi:hypothetical protein
MLQLADAVQPSSFTNAYEKKGSAEMLSAGIDIALPLLVASAGIVNAAFVIPSNAARLTASDTVV